MDIGHILTDILVALVAAKAAAEIAERVGVPAVVGEIMAGSSSGRPFSAWSAAATSVGITARVFGDLRMLATAEARIVLGAAVADDVMGLVVLTVVVRLVAEGSVSPLSVLAIVGVALGFLVAGSVQSITAHTTTPDRRHRPPPRPRRSACAPTTLPARGVADRLLPHR